MAEKGVERRLAAILSADVVGYSRLMEADEEATIRALSTCRQNVDELVASHHGRVFGSAGDSVIAEFASAVEAVRCAVEIQRHQEAQDAEGSEDRRMRLRIGINLGDIVVEDGNLLGDGVNIAARLEGLAEPGGLCISANIHEQVTGKLDLGFDDLGEQAVKNITRPVRAYRVRLDGPVGATSTPSGGTLPLPAKPSIAVLPFDNMSGDPEQEYFSDGITEDIITELSRFRSLFVIARNSSFAFKGQPVNVGEVGRKLGVQYVVEGSIRKAGNRVRITAQLVEATTGNHIWAERYDRDLEDIFAVQDEISRTISSTLADRVEGDRLEHVKSKDETSFAAYDYILRGRELAWKYTRAGNATAREMFTKATEISPDNAQAWAWLAQCLAWDFEGWWVEDPEQSLELAFQCATKAFRINANVSEAQISLAYTYLYKRQHDKAINHFQRAMALVPGDASIATRYGMCLMFAGDADASLKEIARSERLSPMDTGVAEWTIGCRIMALYMLRRYEDALAGYRELPHLIVEERGLLAAIYAQMGDDDAARAALADFKAQAREEFPTFPGDTPGGWTRYWWCMQPFRNDDDLEHVLDGLRKAGLDV